MAIARKVRFDHLWLEFGFILHAVPRTIDGDYVALAEHPDNWCGRTINRGFPAQSL